MSLIQKHMPAVLVGNIVVSPILVYVLYGAVPGKIILGWLAINYAFTCFRWVGYFRLQKILSTLSGEEVQKELTKLIVFSGISGLIWGGAGVAFFQPEQPFSVAILVLILAGMVAGSVASTSAYPRIYFCYAVPTLLPIAVLMLISGEPKVASFGGLAILFLLINLAYCRNIHHTVTETLKLRFENLELVEALREQRDLANKANIAKSKFLAAASHDLRQPLHAQGLYLEGLGEEVASARGKRLLASVNNAKHVLDLLFDSLLDLSRLDAGVVDPELCVFDIRPLLESIANDFTLEAKEKGLLFDAEFHSINVYSDRLLLDRMIRNLVSNAIRYTDSGEVQLKCRREGENLVVEVSDTGIGVPKEELQNIFSEYHQLNNPERDRNKGLGLGLAIVSRLAVLLKIEISVASEVGKGTTFALQLGISADDVTEEHAITEQARQPASVMPNPEATVLVIDDEKDILEGMCSLLEGWGYKCFATGSEKEALALIIEHGVRLDLVIADYRLRENKKGTDAIHRIREEINIDIPGIIVTGDTAADRIVEAKESGFRLLFKPVAPAVLRTAIAQELSV